MIGRVTVAWNDLEMVLCGVFTTLLGAPGDRAYAAFFSLQNHHSRREMIAAVGDAALADAALRGRLNTLLKRVQKAARKRNEIAHGVVSASIESGVQRILPHKGVAPERVSIPKLQSDLAQIRAVTGDLIQFLVDLPPERRPPWPDTRP
jgi:hypothetical protein